MVISSVVNSIIKPVVIGEASTPFLPTDISNILSWVDASDTATISISGSTFTWNDKTVNNNDWTQTTLSRHPATGTRTINSLNVLDFVGGTSKYLDSSAGITAITQADNNTFVMLFAVDESPPAAQQGILGSNNEQYFIYARPTEFIGRQNGASGVVLSDAPTNVTYIAVLRRNGATVDFTISRSGSSLTGSSDASDTESTALYLGTVRPFFGFFNGAIAEVIAYTKTLSNTEVNNLCNYLATKWGGAWTNL